MFATKAEAEACADDSSAHQMGDKWMAGAAHTMDEESGGWELSGSSSGSGAETGEVKEDPLASFPDSYSVLSKKQVDSAGWILFFIGVIYTFWVRPPLLGSNHTHTHPHEASER
jgi:hypothetical protein